jgi:hypothetical protein
MEIPVQVLAALESEKAQRAAAVSEYLQVVACLGRMVDQLGNLHADLSDDDGLHQTLHSLSFLWGYVETELLIAAQVHRN